MNLGGILMFIGAPLLLGSVYGVVTGFTAGSRDCFLAAGADAPSEFPCKPARNGAKNNYYQSNGKSR
jgi:hypothetical protein